MAEMCHACPVVSEAKRRPGGARPDGPLLERQQIVDAALLLTSRHGLGGMSMRKLGDELGVTSMAIYWYFKRKDLLVDAITERVFSMIEIPALDEQPWNVRLRALAHAVHRVLVQYPGIADQIFTHQNYPASAVRLVEYGVATLRDAGLDEAEAAAAFDILSSVVITRSHFEAHQRLVTATSDGPSSLEERVAQAWDRLDQAIDSDVPNARYYVDHLDEHVVGPALFDGAVDIVLAGMQSQLADRG